MGDTLWTRIFGGANYDCAVSVLESNDNGFILAGVTRSFGAGADDIYLIKTNANGDTLWTKTYGGIHDDDPSCIQKTNDGGYIICGFTYSFGAGLADVYVIKIDSIGDTLWTKTYGGSNFDCGEFIQQTLDSGYIICGVTNSFGAGDYDVYLIKTNSLGDTLWTKTFGGANYDAGYSAFQCRHGGYIICGCTQSFGIDSNNVYFIKTDESGNTYCHQGNTSTISTTPLTQITNPQTHISLGSIVNIPQTLLSSGMINTNICSMVGIIEINPTPSLLLSPNPFSTQATLTFQGIKNENYKTLSVYNILGQEVQTIFVGAATSITINRNNLPSGMYFYKLYDESKTVLGIGKMMVE
ncbi:MAG: T9SS type A sorting domain-containing protein [Bacteroidota bacterium]